MAGDDAFRARAYRRGLVGLARVHSNYNAPPSLPESAPAYEGVRDRRRMAGEAKRYCPSTNRTTRRHSPGLLEPLGTAGNLTSDAHLAALAIEYGAELCSADTDFGRFQGLRWTNPLKS